MALATCKGFNVPDGLRVGTLDSLMALSDDLAKMDTVSEKTAFKIYTKLLELKGEAPTIRSIDVASYVTGGHWEWDETKFQINTPPCSVTVAGRIGGLDDEPREDHRAQHAEGGDRRRQAGCRATCRWRRSTRSTPRTTSSTRRSSSPSSSASPRPTRRSRGGVRARTRDALTRRPPPPPTPTPTHLTSHRLLPSCALHQPPGDVQARVGRREDLQVRDAKLGEAARDGRRVRARPVSLAPSRPLARHPRRARLAHPTRPPPTPRQVCTGEAPPQVRGRLQGDGAREAAERARVHRRAREGGRRQADERRGEAARERAAHELVLDQLHRVLRHADAPGVRVFVESVPADGSPPPPTAAAAPPNFTAYVLQPKRGKKEALRKALHTLYGGGEKDEDGRGGGRPGAASASSSCT